MPTRGHAIDRLALGLMGAGLCLSCTRSSLVDLPLWRVETDPAGREVRLVQLPFEETSYDLTSHALVRRVADRNQDGVPDRIVTYEGVGAARTEETDANFDGVVDGWDTYGSDGRRLRSATAQWGSRPDRIAHYDGTGSLSRLEVDANFDGRFDIVRIYERGKLVEIRIDSDNNGRTDRVQDLRRGYLGAEDFDTDENGTADLRMTYAEDGSLLKVTILKSDPKPPRQGLR